MNYLAHLFVSRRDSESLAGSILADFVSARGVESYSALMRSAIRLHRRIDAFTDTHPEVRRGKARMRPPYRRYAGVLLDIFFDHYLARDWQRYSPEETLEDFSAMAYEALAGSRPILPPRLKRVLPFMVEENWLVSYRQVDNIDRTLRRLSRRLKHENPLPHAICMLHENYRELESDFERFFPELVRFAREEQSRSDAA